MKSSGTKANPRGKSGADTVSRAFDMEEGCDEEDDNFDVNGDGGGNDGDDADARPLKGAKGKSNRTEGMEARYGTIAPRTCTRTACT